MIETHEYIDIDSTRFEHGLHLNIDKRTCSNFHMEVKK